MTDPVYLDNAATTPLDPRVLESMLAHFEGASRQPLLTARPRGLGPRRPGRGPRLGGLPCSGPRLRRSCLPAAGPSPTPWPSSDWPGRLSQRSGTRSSRAWSTRRCGRTRGAYRKKDSRCPGSGSTPTASSTRTSSPRRCAPIRRSPPRSGRTTRSAPSSPSSSLQRHVPRGTSRFTPTPSRLRAGSPSMSAGRRSRRWPSPGTSSTALRASAPCTCETASGLSPSSVAEARKRV